MRSGVIGSDASLMIDDSLMDVSYLIVSNSADDPANLDVAFAVHVIFLGLIADRLYGVMVSEIASYQFRATSR